MADFKGFFNTSGTRTTVRHGWNTFAAAGGSVAPSSAFDSADIRIYKNLGAAQRTSANGVTVVSPFDGIVGDHNVSIDLTDNSDAGFYVAGYYEVKLNTAKTVDAQTVNTTLFCFEIGRPEVDIRLLSGAAIAAVGTPGYMPSDVIRYDDTSTAGQGTFLATIKAAVDTEIATLQTSVNDLPTNAELATALAAADDAVLAAIAGLPTADVLTAIYEGTETLQDFFRLARAVLTGDNTPGSHPLAPEFLSADGLTVRVAATLDPYGNRSGTTVDPS